MGTKQVTTCDITGRILSSGDEEIVTIDYDPVDRVLNVRFNKTIIGQSDPDKGLVFSLTSLKQRAAALSKKIFDKAREAEDFCLKNQRELSEKEESERREADGYQWDSRPTDENGGRGGPGDR
jgi:hypothetical protein